SNVPFEIEAGRALIREVGSEKGKALTSTGSKTSRSSPTAGAPATGSDSAEDELRGYAVVRRRRGLQRNGSVEMSVRSADRGRRSVRDSKGRSCLRKAIPRSRGPQW